MSQEIVLLPAPRRLERYDGTMALPQEGWIELNAPHADRMLPIAEYLKATLEGVTGHAFAFAAVGRRENAGSLRLAIDPEVGTAQGYVLRIGEKGVLLTAHDLPGLFYGAQTLAQLVRQFPDRLPRLRIEDYPDFPVRGVMLDISRDKVPTLETLFALVDQLAEWKINQFQLYTEHTFAYRDHREVWAQASALTGEDILRLDAHCRARFIDLVPNQNSFGHMERWLKYPRYRHLAEAPDGFTYPWGGRVEGAFSLCPGDPGSLELLESLYDELLPHFSSPLFNVGCDETFDLGQGRSRNECAQRGTERVYLDFLLKVYALVKRHGRTMQFWGDIILHKPELIPELPSDVIALEWGYEAEHPFAEHGAHFANAGIPFYVCPGTSSWNTIAGRTDNALGCLKNAAENGLPHGAIGYLNTDWGDNGHLQYLPVSYLGYAMGAAYSWCAAANESLPVADALSRHVFHDRVGQMGQVAYDLGNVYQACGKRVGNASVLFHLLHHGATEKVLEGLTLDGLRAAEAAIEEAMAPLGQVRMNRPDAVLILDEFRNAAALLRIGCRIGRRGLHDETVRADDLAADLRQCLGEHARLWMARNRVGGLADSPRSLAARLSELTGKDAARII